MKALPAFRSHHRTAAAARSGFSLIEVMLATAILLGSVIVLAQLVGMGRTQAEKAKLHSEAQRICETTLHEIVLGIRPLLPVELSPLEPAIEIMPEQRDERESLDVEGDIVRRRSADSRGSGADAKWLHSIRLALHPTVPALTILTVEVQQAEESSARPVRFELTRWVRQAPERSDSTQNPDFRFSDVSTQGGRG